MSNPSRYHIPSAITDTRRSRRWTPKVRTGCLTCKIRRIKCDETRPRCEKCTSTGRQCDGYTDQMITQTQSQGASRSISRVTKHGAEKRDRAASPKAQSDFISWVPFYGGLMHKQYFDYFRSVSYSAFSSFFGRDFWVRQTLQAAHQNPALFHAVTAFASIHQGYLYDTTPSYMSRTSATTTINKQIRFGLSEFNKAIQFMCTLMKQEKLYKTDQQVILTTCVLFAGLSLLQGRQPQVFMHVKTGMMVIQNWQLISEPTTREENNAIETLLLTFIRIDTQIRLFLLGQDSLLESICPDLELPSLLKRPYNNLFEAYFDVEVFFNRVSRLYANAHRTETLSEDVAYLKDLGDAWDSRFECLVPNEEIRATQSEKLDLIRNRREYSRLILSTLVAESVDGNDEILTTFQTIMSLSPRILQKDIRTPHNSVVDFENSDHPIFVFDSAVVGPLFFVATRCREPVLRRQALQLLLDFPRREGFCEGMMICKVIRKVIEIEEQECPRYLEWSERQASTGFSDIDCGNICHKNQSTRSPCNQSSQYHYVLTSKSKKSSESLVNDPMGAEPEASKMARPEFIGVTETSSSCTKEGEWVCLKHRVVELKFLLLAERQVTVVISTYEDFVLNRQGRQLDLTLW